MLEAAVATLERAGVGSRYLELARAVESAAVAAEAAAARLIRPSLRYVGPLPGDAEPAGSQAAGAR